MQDKCKKTGVVFESVVSTVDVINSSDVKVQGAAPSFSIDGTSGAILYLSPYAPGNTEVVTSKSSEVNLVVNKADVRSSG